MNLDPRLLALWELMDRAILVLSRSVVQRQLAAFGVVFLLAWLLPYLLDRYVDQRMAAITAKPVAARTIAPWRYRMLRVARGIEFTFFPLLGLLLSQLAVSLFESRSWQAGLIKELRPIFWLLFIYRVLEGLLFAIIDDAAVKLYSRRILAPLVLLLAAVSISRSLRGTFPIGNIDLFQLGESTVTVATLFTALVILYFFFVFAWMIRQLLNRYVVARIAEDTGVANAIVISSYYGILTLGPLTAISTLGFDLSTLTSLVGGLTVGISFGLQDLVANFVSGILLLFDHTLRPGDVIEVAGVSGTVDKLRLRSTVLRTPDNAEVFVPNKTLLTSAVETYTFTDRRVRRTIAVRVKAEHEPSEIRDLLLALVARHGLVLKRPAPSVMFMAFDADSLDFNVNFWIDEPPRSIEITSDLHYMIYEEFSNSEIAIAR